MKIGFIGLGNLGTPIAENLLDTRKSLHIYNRTQSKIQPLIVKGAVAAGSVKALASLCDVIFTIVSDDDALAAITTGEAGLAANMRSGSIHVSLSTVLPETSSKLHALHVKEGSQYLACPVMGRPEAARARKMNFLISGDPASIETVKPLLTDAGGALVWDFGNEIGAANVAKLCSNYLILTAMEAMAEGINLADRSGLDTQLWMKMLTQSFFMGPVYTNYSKIIIDKAFVPAGFSLRLGLKDMNLVLKQAMSVEASMPVGEQVQVLLKDSADNGLADHDVTSVSLTIGGQRMK